MRDPFEALEDHFSACAEASPPASLEVPALQGTRPLFEGLAIGLALALCLAMWTPVMDLAEARSAARALAARQVPPPDRLPAVELGAILPRRPERLA